MSFLHPLLPLEPSDRRLRDVRFPPPFSLAGRALGMAVLLSLAALLPAAAQDAPAYSVHPDYTMRRWTVADGLPVNAVTAVHKDAQDYLWLTTLDGLVRFDGTVFTVFNASNTEGLPNNRLTSLSASPTGQLLVQTELYQLLTFDGVRFAALDAQPGMSHSISVLRYAPSDTLWVGAQEGLYRRAPGESFVEVAPVVAPTSFISRPDGTRWISTAAHGVYHQSSSGALTRYTRRHGLPSDAVSSILRDRSGRLWAATDLGLAYFENGRFHQALGPDGDVLPLATYALHQGPDRLWLSSSEGWYVVDTRPGPPRIQPAGLGPRETTILVPPPWTGPEGHWWVATPRAVYRDGTRIYATQGSINAAFHDPEGNLWIADSEHGLFLLQPASLRVIGLAEGLPGHNVYGLAPGRAGRVWFALFDGAHLIRWQAGQRTSYHTSDGSLPFQLFWVVATAPDGTVWAGGSGLCRFEDERCRRVRLPYSVLFSVRALYWDQRGHFWVGTQEGLLYRPGPEAPWQHFTTEEGLTSNWVRAFYELRDGTLLLGTFGGGMMTHDAAGFHPLTRAQGFPSDNVRAFYEDADGILWVGTEDQGLVRIERQPGVPLAASRWTVIQQKDGLLDDTIHQILEDAAGQLWMNTNQGIFRVARADLDAFAEGKLPAVSHVAYTERDGMRDREGNGGVQPAGFKAEDGHLWFPTQGGVVVIDPAQAQAPPLPLAVLEQVEVNGQHRAATPRTLTLTPEERDLTFHYVAPYFAKPEEVQYRYRLTGYDDAWHEAGPRRQATYTNLPPGAYTFEVEAGLGGRWREAETRLTVERRPFLWETGWFIGLIVALAGLLGAGFVWQRLHAAERRNRELAEAVRHRTEQIRTQAHQLQEQADHLQALDRMKSRFFANISHEFRTPLTLILGPLGDLLQGQAGALPKAATQQLTRVHRNGQRLLRLINQILDLSSLEAGALGLHADRHDLVAFLMTQTAAFRSLADLRQIDLRFETTAEALPCVFDAGKLEKVVMNLLSNALKFTPPGGSVTVRVLPLGAGACFSVTDTGEGIDADALPYIFDRFYQVNSSSTRRHEGTGIGLALVQELVALHGGEVAVASTVGQGTTFTVTLPVLPPVASPPPAATPAAPLPTGDGGLGQAAEGQTPTAPGAARPDHQAQVLVVEDNADLRAYLASCLPESYEVFLAADGCEGQSLAQEVVPDVIISDVMMPCMDGFALCAAIKRDLRTSHIPVLLLTARADAESRVEGLSAGADVYLPKPFDASVLRAYLHSLLENRRRLHAATRQADAPALTLEAPTLSSMDEAFLNQVRAALEANLADPDFHAETLAEKVGLSARQFLRKLESLTGEKPMALLRRVRMERAAQMLREQAGTIKEVAYAVGYRSPSGFRKGFKEHFGVAPSQYVRTGHRADVT